MELELKENEQVIKEGAANLQRGWETVGGNLCLTNHRLVFQSHSLTVNRGKTEIELATIQSAKLGWTKFLGFIPLAPNSLVIIVEPEIEHRFVLFGRKKWLEEIESVR